MINTFALSYDRLDPADDIDQLALALLARAAHFVPGEPIPRALLLATVERPESKPNFWGRISRLFRPKKPEVTPDRLEDAAIRLVELGLLEAEADGSFRLHRLLAAFVKDLAPDGKAQAAVEVVLLVEANRLNNAGYLVPLLKWQVHLWAVTDVARTRVDERAAGLCNTLGYHLLMIGDYAGARPYYERALAIREKALGPDHPDTASSLNNLAVLCFYENKFEEAAALMRQALAIWEAKLGPDHPHTQTSRRSLAAIEQRLDDSGAAASQ